MDLEKAYPSQMVLAETQLNYLRNHYEDPQGLDVINKNLEEQVSTFSRCDPETKVQRKTETSEQRPCGRRFRERMENE